MSEKLLFNPGAMAYHFMIHEFKLVHKSTFEEENFSSFVIDFSMYAKRKGYVFVDKNGNEVSDQQKIDTILDNYTKHAKEGIFDKRVCYFTEDALDEMRKNYDNCNHDNKNLILGYEQEKIKFIYEMKYLYGKFEEAYRKDAKSLKKDDDMNLA